MEFEDSINITYDILDYIFQRLETEDVPVKQIMPCLAFYENVIAQHEKNILLWETKNYLKKLQMTLRGYIQISQKKGKKTKPRHHGIHFRKLFQF